METTQPSDPVSRLTAAAAEGVEVNTGAVARLRVPAERDVASMVLAGNDPFITAFTELPSPYEVRHATEFITTLAPAGMADGTMAPFVIADAADELLGVVSLHDIDATGVASVGFWVAPWARGQQVAATALIALAAWSFDVVGLRHLVWQSLVGNTTSLRVATNAGFIPEGTARGLLRHRGQIEDCWLASLGPRDVRAPNHLRVRTDVEIAAGAWQLQPLSTMEEGVGAERVLPVSACVPTGVWAVKHAVTAAPGAYVALLTQDAAGWVVAAPAADAPASDAAVTGRDAVLRYARGALGLHVL